LKLLLPDGVLLRNGAPRLGWEVDRDPKAHFRLALEEEATEELVRSDSWRSHPTPIPGVTRV